jgi:hypothetical protein
MAISDSKLLSLLYAPLTSEAEVIPKPDTEPLIEAPDIPIVLEDPAPEVADPIDTETIKEKELGKKPDSKNVLSSVFTEEAIEILSNLSTEKLQTISLKEALSEITAQSLIGSWSSTTVDGKEVLSAEFSFNQYESAAEFVSDVLNQCSYTKRNLFSLSLNPFMENKWKATFSLLGDEGKLNTLDLKVAQYCNYRYTTMGNETQDPYEYFDDVAATVEPENIPYRLSDKEFSAIEIQVLGEGSSRKLKVPIAVIGEWKHPTYGELSFTQQDFDEMQVNMFSKVIGYEPPLFKGHHEDTYNGVSGGQPAEGFLESLSQEDSVLYGIFESVSDATYNEVDEDKFRYSSGEFLRNYKSKKDGQVVGTALVGCALTNRPFLTGLPRVTTLSDQHYNTVLLTDKHMTTNAPTSAAPVQETPVVSSTANELQLFTEFKTQIKEELATVKQNFAEEVSTLKQELSDSTVKLQESAQKLSEVSAERDTLALKVKEVEDSKRASEVAIKLSEIESLVISKDEKEKYSELIKSGALGANEATIISTLKSVSEKMSQTVTEQYGSETATHALNDSTVTDPYAKTIEHNRALSQEREARLLERLA